MTRSVIFQSLMATITVQQSKPRRVCFSFAAYAKSLIQHLKNSNIPVEDGLSDDEFSTIESTFNFKFLPDLRSILQEGLPVGPGFPNWRSSSHQQLQILMNLPVLGICREVSRSSFWVGSWGERPDSIDKAVRLAGLKLRESPLLVPIHRNCYIPSSPFLAGNPVFEVRGCDVTVCSFDIAGFFQRGEFGLNTPPWAATQARTIEFWTELAARGWWIGELGGCLENVCWRLREGGWKEEEVREMMLMDGGDREMCSRDNHVLRDKEGVVWYARVLSLRLLRAGWSMEDVVDSLGLPDSVDVGSWFADKSSDGGCEDYHQIRSIKHLFKTRSSIQV